MRYQGIAWSAVRVLFGLYFLLATVMVMVKFGGNHPPESVAAAAHFTLALDATGFMTPLLIASFLVAGVAVLFDRTAPVGLIILGPSVLVIACFHWFLTGKYVWGTIWPVWYLVLVWHYRHVFARLWARQPS
ncbi:hypothetical protein [Brevundimonas sp.]|uniref:hypothetical protein n=1 Tax=Brevundimonas sp. TaxID=1871086 RepID=UPI002FC6D146